MFPLKGTPSSEVTLTGITTSSPGWAVILPTVTSVGIFSTVTLSLEVSWVLFSNPATTAFSKFPEIVVLKYTLKLADSPTPNDFNANALSLKLHSPLILTYPS